RESDFEPLSAQPGQGFLCARPGTRRRGRPGISEKEVDYGTNQQRCSRVETAAGRACAAAGIAAIPCPAGQRSRLSAAIRIFEPSTHQVGTYFCRLRDSDGHFLSVALPCKLRIDRRRAD